mmetsp:Transcript_39852/g.52518  ORF Transcript_39852/g.52518 Transcript_39852/m.52518 type:complete len:317 (+) Transcript_39852:44-994(+)
MRHKKMGILRANPLSSFLFLCVLLSVILVNVSGNKSNNIISKSSCESFPKKRCKGSFVDQKLIQNKKKCLRKPAGLMVTGGAEKAGEHLIDISKPNFDMISFAANAGRFVGELFLLASMLAILKSGSISLNLQNPWKTAVASMIWLTIVFGSSFLVNLPGKWAESVQLLKPTTPGASQMEWYSNLVKPSWNPPAWLFPLMWIPLKILQLIASVIVWEKVDMDLLHPAIVSFLGYQTLGDLWNKVFFDQRRIGFGLLVIYIFYGYLIASTVQFWKVSKVAGGLIFPTNLWVLVASSLNLSIWLKNGKEPLYPAKKSA